MKQIHRPRVEEYSGVRRASDLVQITFESSAMVLVSDDEFEEEEMKILMSLYRAVTPSNKQLVNEYKSKQ
jgi:hypothetical protein